MSLVSTDSSLPCLRLCSTDSRIIETLVSPVTVPRNSISVWFPIILAELPQDLGVLVKNGARAHLPKSNSGARVSVSKQLLGDNSGSRCGTC